MCDEYSVAVESPDYTYILTTVFKVCGLCHEYPKIVSSGLRVRAVVPEPDAPFWSSRVGTVAYADMCGYLPSMENGVRDARSCGHLASDGCVQDGAP